VRLNAAAAVLAFTTLLATGCSSAGDTGDHPAPGASRSPSSTSTSASSSPSASSASAGSSTPVKQGATITIKGYKYSGAASVKAGSTVTVENDDSVAHTVTGDKGHAFDVIIPGGASKTFTAPKAGTYPYHCTYHANMHGTLTVS
jgi:plastocyanin